MAYIEDLPFPKEGQQTNFQLNTDLYIEQWIIPVTTIIKLKTTTNFGYVILPKDCKDKEGFIIPKRIFKF